jgi:lysophospholipase L1-like esterase
VLVAQALYARLTIPRLEEPTGPREGTVGDGASLSLLVLGDSSAAGVGAPHQDIALAAPLACQLAALCSRCVSWRLVAASGLNTLELVELWRASGRPAADLVVVVSGVNDVVDRLGVAAVAAARRALMTGLQASRGVRHVTFTPLPPMHAFSGLPEPLRSFAGARAREHNDALSRWQASQPGTSLLSFQFQLAARMLAADGFHPGPAAYEAWAGALARHLATRLPGLP